MNDHFGTTRAALAASPSLDAFERVCIAICRAFHVDPKRTVAQLLPYALDHLSTWPDATRSLPRGRVIPSSMEAHLELYLMDEVIPYGLLHGQEQDDAIDPDAFDDSFGVVRPRIVLHGPLVLLAKELHIDAPYVDGEYQDVGTAKTFASQLLNFEGVGHITGLWLQSSVNGSVGFGALTDDALEELVEAGALDGFSSLNLTDHFLGDAGILTLSRMSHLRSLTLRDVELDTTQFASLVQSPEMAELRTLALGCRYLSQTPIDLATLLDPQTCTLRHLEALDLSNLQFPQNSITALANAPHLSTLRSLDLTGCHVTNADWRALAESARMSAPLRAYAQTQLI